MHQGYRHALQFYEETTEPRAFKLINVQSKEKYISLLTDATMWLQLGKNNQFLIASGMSFAGQLENSNNILKTAAAHPDKQNETVAFHASKNYLLKFEPIPNLTWKSLGGEAYFDIEDINHRQIRLKYPVNKTENNINLVPKYSPVIIPKSQEMEIKFVSRTGEVSSSRILNTSLSDLNLAELSEDLALSEAPWSVEESEDNYTVSFNDTKGEYIGWIIEGDNFVAERQIEWKSGEPIRVLKPGLALDIKIAPTIMDVRGNNVSENENKLSYVSQ